MPASSSLRSSLRMAFLRDDEAEADATDSGRLRDDDDVSDFLRWDEEALLFLEKGNII